MRDEHSVVSSTTAWKNFTRDRQNSPEIKVEILEILEHVQFTQFTFRNNHALTPPRIPWDISGNYWSRLTILFCGETISGKPLSY